MPITASLISGKPRRDTWRHGPPSSYPEGQAREPTSAGGHRTRNGRRHAEAQTPNSVLFDGVPAASASLNAFSPPFGESSLSGMESTIECTLKPETPSGALVGSVLAKVPFALGSTS